MSLLDDHLTSKAPNDAPATGAERGRGRAGLRTWPPSLLVGATLFGLILITLILTPWIMPHDPAAQNLADRLAPSGATHPLGSDHLGRDVLSRLMDGGRFSVSIAAITLLICAVSGTLVGIVCARRGGKFDEFVMRLTDVLLAFPEIIVALFLVAVLGTNYGTLILALVIGGWTPFARLARSVALEIGSHDYIEAARALGCSSSFIMFRHILPNALSPLLAHTAVRFGHKLITVGALSYLGLGIQPPDADWGSMLATAQPYLTKTPGLIIYPGLAIFVTALSVTLIGQGLNARRNQRG
ncbi:ABC transporter permease [Nonomuraea sp. NEAU-A123]|uniref:ABC transporter permease n=1 Tax=Nonomuraea sp. NEAU-A123 TaxID=2839649 RepID=UPI001BE4B976|nr:ABC transporter permease [Nonomuraea sp. NEAU-A123]MBT2224704.1 ABC transporter permease [Nonomuraea sp. NEAU-A123]